MIKLTPKTMTLSLLIQTDSEFEIINTGPLNSFSSLNNLAS